MCRYFLIVISSQSEYQVQIIIHEMQKFKKYSIISINNNYKQLGEDSPQIAKYTIVQKALNQSLKQTIIESQIVEQIEKQADKIHNYLQQKTNHSIQQRMEEIKRSITNKSYLMEMVNHYIYEIADRNEAIDANYAHFLMLLYLTIQEIIINIGPSEHLTGSQKFIFIKLQNKIVKRQLSQNLYYEFMTFVLRKHKIDATKLHSFMRKIMTVQRQVCIAIFPYYFNLFAFVVNKQVIFNGQPEQNLIPYTFQIFTEKRYKSNFSRQEVFKQMRRIEKLTIDKYHSPQL